jgi:hypothetical protein
VPAVRGEEPRKTPKRLTLVGYHFQKPRRDFVHALAIPNLFVV